MGELEGYHAKQTINYMFYTTSETEGDVRPVK